MLAAAKRKDWNAAYLDANGLSMTETTFECCAFRHE